MSRTASEGASSGGQRAVVWGAALLSLVSACLSVYTALGRPPPPAGVSREELADLRRDLDALREKPAEPLDQMQIRMGLRHVSDRLAELEKRSQGAAGTASA